MRTLENLNMPLLDKQIHTLHKLEVSEHLSEDDRDHVSGLCEFLCLLYAELNTDEENLTSSQLLVLEMEGEMD